MGEAYWTYLLKGNWRNTANVGHNPSRVAISEFRMAIPKFRPAQLPTVTVSTNRTLASQKRSQPSHSDHEIADLNDCIISESVLLHPPSIDDFSDVGL